jgi:AbrB family looped-hinge helix DNA binding protein
MHNSSTITEKGQIVIPAEIRKKLDLKKGMRVSFVEKKGQIIMQPITDDYIESLFGSAKTKGKVLKSLFKDKEYEKNL